MLDSWMVRPAENAGHDPQNENPESRSAIAVAAPVAREGLGQGLAAALLLLRQERARRGEADRRPERVHLRWMRRALQWDPACGGRAPRCAGADRRTRDDADRAASGVAQAAGTLLRARAGGDAGRGRHAAQARGELGGDRRGARRLAPGGLGSLLLTCVPRPSRPNSASSSSAAPSTPLGRAFAPTGNGPRRWSLDLFQSQRSLHRLDA